MKAPLLALLALLVFSVPALALQASDNIYFTLAPEELEKCINIILPDDSDVLNTGIEEYIIVCQSDWKCSITETRIRTDENNTVITPVCFSGIGKREGQCSNFTIYLSAPSLGVSRQFRGGVCVSSIPDVDVVSDPGDREPWDIINSHVDILSIGFQNSIKYATPGQWVNYTLFVQSHADLVIDLTAEGLNIIPPSDIVSTSSTSPAQTLVFDVQAPQTKGQHTFTVRGTVRDCNLNSCTHEAQGKLIVTDTIPDNPGFTVSLFPVATNVRGTQSVQYRFTIKNGDKERVFSTSINISPSTQTTFQPLNISVGANEERTITFTVAPSSASSQYEITVKAKTNGNAKPATAYLSTNEMLTDPTRDVNNIINNTGNQNVANNADNALDNWYNTYRNSGYGHDLDDYGNLRDTLDSARSQPQQPDAGGAVPDAGQDYQHTDNFWSKNSWIIIIIVVAVVVILLFFAYNKSGPAESDFHKLEKV